ncbi:NAD(P)-dependent oxidoreductase [Aureimonas ureilytica]|uniref:NAD(P)-dependent oxidoreductase n=1 Tax=Aureimonas ureilytica TaxID=401562 RepID=UPI003CF39C2D
MEAPILFAGGTGIVGREAVRAFRERHPSMPILIGGRDLARAQTLASEVGNASAIRIDIDRPRLGLGEADRLGAVVMTVPDEGLNGLVPAQDLGIPYLSMGNWLVEVGAEMAHFIRRPDASPVVLASHWHGGPAVFLTQVATADMDVVHSVAVGAVVDERDATGPAAVADMERGAEGGSGVWAFEDGRRVWLTGAAATREFRTLDGRALQGRAFSPYDIVSLQAMTRARSVRFDLATAESSNRSRGGSVATELIVEIEGELGGRPMRRRVTLEFGKGQAALTGLGGALALSTVLGLEGRPAYPPGLYFPERLMEADWYLSALKAAGAVIDLGEHDPSGPNRATTQEQGA